MSSDLMLDVGQANELKLAFRKANYTNDDIKRLCEGNILTNVRNVLLGFSEVKPIDHVIDLDAAPFIPDGWKVEKHQKGGSFKWDPKKVSLYLSKQQKEGSSINGKDLQKKLGDEPVLNANVLDYLLANKHLIPEDSETRRTRSHPLHLLLGYDLPRLGRLPVRALPVLGRRAVDPALPLARPRLGCPEPCGSARTLALRILNLGLL